MTFSVEIVLSDSFLGKYGVRRKYLYSKDVEGKTKMGVINKVLKELKASKEINQYEEISIKCVKKPFRF
jgi:hypothetical protein